MAYHRYVFGRVVDGIIDDILHLPDGYSFWQSLTPYRRKQYIRKWNHSITDTVFSDHARRILLQACLNQQGVVSNRLLYIWLVDHAYHGMEGELFNDWLRLVKERAVK